jgi:outer membrane lipoprotein carrier protein
LNTRSCAIFMLIVLSLGTILQGAAFPDDRVDTILNGLHRTYGSVQGLTALYTREAISKTMVTLGATEKRDIARGRLYFKPPYLLRLEQSSPQEELLITDGQKLWWYIPKKKEAYRYSADAFGTELRLLGEVFQGLSGARNKFKITCRQNPDTGDYYLELTPDPPWKDIDHLELIIEKGTFRIEQVDIVNTIGGLTRFILSKVKEDVPLSDELFSFSPPPGAKLIVK